MYARFWVTPKKIYKYPLFPNTNFFVFDHKAYVFRPRSLCFLNTDFTDYTDFILNTNDTNDTNFIRSIRAIRVR